MSRVSFISRCAVPVALCMVTLVSATVVTALADDAAPKRMPAALAERAAPVRKAMPQPSAQHVFLIRTTLLTLENANRTGNYTVLRDSAGPTFQQRHSSADLALAFQKVRGSVDLTPVALRMPELTRPPLVTPDQHLQLAGVVPGDVAPVAFEMMFEAVGGHWRLEALAVGPAKPR